jgi:hypothetical protein
MRPGLVSLFAILLVLAPAGSASANSCKSTAELRSGELHRLGPGTRFEKGDTLRRPHAYEAQRKSKIRFQGVTYVVAPDSWFALGCFGHSLAQGVIYPSMTLHKGQVKMISSGGKPGSVVTNEAMADPFADRGMRIVVKRRPKKDPLMFGKTWVDKVKGRGYVNLTPYVGPRSGTCRQVDGGKFVSRKLVNNYFKGSAYYRGFAPGSPR